MTTYVLIATLVTCVSGWASRYDPGIMPGTVQVQKEMGRLPQNTTKWSGFIAVSDCSLIGDTWWVSSQGGAFRPYLVSDCSGHIETSRWMAQNNILLEFGWEEVVKLGLPTRGGSQVEVCTTRPIPDDRQTREVNNAKFRKYRSFDSQHFPDSGQHSADFPPPSGQRGSQRAR